jgi:hypothetical protein
MKDFLFVAGCARSGTSALAQLLSGSKDIVLGMERYGHLVHPRRFTLTSKHFEKDRFFEVLKGDTFYDSFDNFHKFDPLIKEKFQNAKYIGDKRPDLYEAYGQLFTEFPKAKLLFIYRDVLEVASSYHGRIDQGDNWPSSKNYEKAVFEWNRSLYLTREQLAKGSSIKVINYKDIFLTDTSLSPLNDFLEIEQDETWKKHIESVRSRAKHLEKNRLTKLTEAQTQYVIENAKSFLVDDIAPARIL